MERRDFLKLVGAGILFWYLAPEIERVSGSNAKGVILTKQGINPAILAEARAVKLSVSGLTQYGMVNIVDFAGYDYLVETKAAGRVKIAMDQVMIIEGDPVPVRVGQTFLGIRNDVPEFMAMPGVAGMKNVRISGRVEEIGQKGSALETTITAAENIGYRPLVVFNTWYPRDKASVEKMATDLVSSHECDIELLNEPNDPVFWKNGDLESAAETIAVATKAIKRKKPTVKVIAAALTDPSKMMVFVKMLKAKEVYPGQIEFAAHGYQTPEVVEQMVRAVVGATGRAAVLTEVGVRGDNKRGIITVLDKVWQLHQRGWVSRAYIHELPNFEGWGFYNPYNKTPESYFYYLPAWLRNHGLG